MAEALSGDFFTSELVRVAKVYDIEEVNGQSRQMLQVIHLQCVAGVLVAIVTSMCLLLRSFWVSAFFFH